ncbi:MAG: NADH:ubiquinone oxidoreductase [Ignavibacteriaceae bacterium]
MNNWWLPYGLKRRLTEKKLYQSDIDVKPLDGIFRKSLHIYIIDVGNSNDLCFEIRALQAPQYNIHRFGIFFADTPRHADVLVVLGPATEKMIGPLKETINQLPKPFGVILIESGSISSTIDLKNIIGENLLAEIKNYSSPEQIISVLLKIMNKWQNEHVIPAKPGNK